MKFNPFHFWTKNYEWDLLAPARQIVKDIKGIRKFNKEKKLKRKCGNLDCPHNQFGTCFEKTCPENMCRKEF